MAGRPVHTFDVVRTEQLTPHIMRVVLGGSGFDTFTPNEFTDAYFKILFVRRTLDVAALPAAADDGQLQRLCPRRTTAHRSAPTPCGGPTPQRREFSHRLRRARRARGGRAVGVPRQPRVSRPTCWSRAPMRLIRRPTGICSPVTRRRSRPSAPRWRPCPTTQLARSSSRSPDPRTRSRSAHRPVSR